LKPLGFEYDKRGEAATAAVVLGGSGIFGWAVDRRASLAAAVLVGDRTGGVRFRGFMFLPKRG